MWKRRVSIFLILCLLCGLLPAHAASLPEGAAHAMPAFEETGPPESMAQPALEAEDSSQQGDSSGGMEDTEPPGAPHAEASLFEVRSEGELKDAVSSINSRASGTFTISLLGDIEVTDPGQKGLKLTKNHTILLGNSHTITYAAQISSRGGLGAEGTGVLYLGKEDGTDTLTITATVSQAASLVDSMNGGTVNMYPGVTLTGNQYRGGRFGGGVDIGKNGTFNMYGGTISDCSTTLLEHGGGVGMIEAGAVFNLHDGVIEGNHASGNGGGLYITGGAFHMYGGTVRNNRAGGTGGGIYLTGVPVHITGGTVSGNTAGSYGGGVYVSAEKVTHGAIGFIPSVDPWEEVEIVIPMGGRSRRSSSSPQGISGMTITGNQAGETASIGSGQGAGLYINQCSGLTLSNLQITQNTLQGDRATGSGICISSSAGVTINGSEISGNRGGGGGAGVYLYKSADAILRGCRVVDNTGGTSCQGGGLGARESASLQIIDSEISGNSAEFCGGGIALSYSSTCSLQNSAVTGNDSNTGGGVAVALGTSMTVDDRSRLCNNTASTAGADVNARAAAYGYKATISLPTAAGMNQVYLADGQGVLIDGWYQDTEEMRYTPAEDAVPVSAELPIESGAALVASYRILPGYSLTYDVNGGIEGSGPAAEENLRPGPHTLSKTSPIHAPEGGKAIVFAGWSKVRSSVIYSTGDDAFDLSILLDTVTMGQQDRTVYAVWGYDENDNGTADVVELPDIIEVLPKDPAQPFLPEDPADQNNSHATPVGYVRVIFDAGTGGTFGTYADQSVKTKLAYDVKDGQLWQILTVPVPVERPGYTLKRGGSRWAPSLPTATEPVAGGTYAAQYTKLSGNRTFWYEEVYLQARDDASYSRWSVAQGGAASIGSMVSIDAQKFNGQNTAQGELLGREFIFHAAHPENRLSAMAEDAGRKNPLKIYYQRAPQTITYQYEGTVPIGAPAVPDQINSWYGARVQIAESPALAGYLFSGWTSDTEGAVIDRGILTVPYSNVILKGTWTQAATVTFCVVNGTWPDGTDADKQVLVPLIGGGGTLAASAVPTGMLARTGYTDGAWDTAPDTAAGTITGDVTYTYTFQKAPTEPAPQLLHPTMGIMIEGQRIDVPNEGPAGSNASLPEQFRPIAVTLGSVRRSFETDTVGREGMPLSLSFTSYPNSDFTEGDYPVVVENLPEGYTYELRISDKPVQSPIHLSLDTPNIMLNIQKAPTLLHPTMGIMIEGQRIDVPNEGPAGSNASLPEQFRPIAVTLGSVRRSFETDTVGREGMPLSLSFTSYPNSDFTEGDYPVVVENLPEGYTYEILLNEQPVQSPLHLSAGMPSIMLNLRQTYTLIYNANGGNGDGPAAQTGLLPGRYPLSTTGPTHDPVAGEDVVWIGWTAERDPTIYERGNTSFDPSKLLTTITITSKNETVYALWGRDDDGTQNADVLEQTVTVTFRVTNGTWADGSTADKHVLVLLSDGKGTLPASDVPTGMRAGRGYTGGAWDKQPDTSADAISGDIVYTYSFHKTGGSGGNSSSTYHTLTYVTNGGTAYKTERYRSGEKVTLDKKPFREGYTFTGWYADKTLTDEITSVRMTSDKKVYAGWKQAVSVLHIPDMLNGEEHFAYIAGYTDGTVCPNNDITRAEVAMIFYRLLKDDIRSANESSRNTFTDVTEGMWCNTAISTIARLGIVRGRSAEIFDPDAPITRAEFATICSRFDQSAIKQHPYFPDIGGHWAESFIQRAAALGWIKGYTDGTFRPENHITRAEAMAMINRVLGRLPESASDLLPGMKTWPDNADPDAWYYLIVQEATNSHTFERKADGIHERWIKLKET